MQRIVGRSVFIASLVGAPLGTAVSQTPVAPGAPVAPATQRAAATSDSARGQSNVLPVLEIGGFLVGLSLYDRIAYANVMQDGKKVYSSTFATTWDHLRQQTWVHDQDPFNVNQFQHPYQGATMYAFSRSSGHGFWMSLANANIGSFIWKMAGETDPPSINDMITTGQAGSLLGEALYRMRDLILKDAGEKPRPFAEYAAALISPPGAFNRRVFGDRFKARLPDTDPATFWQVKFGATVAALTKEVSTPTSILHSDATVDFSMSYGLPGQPGYEYTRPLDYFDFQFTVLMNRSNPIENMMIRGLLVGAKDGQDPKASSIWGLYGSYDYISPYLFRVSSTAISLGTTRQYRIGSDVDLQGSLLGGVGYGAAGSTTVIASTPTNAAIRDYHFGVTPQALATFRLIVADRAMLDVAARDYYVSGLGSDDTSGSEQIFRGQFGLTVRVSGGHAIGAQFIVSTRDARYGKLPNHTNAEGTFTLSYSVLGGNLLGAVKSP